MTDGQEKKDALEDLAERIAIMVVDGGLTEELAMEVLERLALGEDEDEEKSK